MESLVSQVYYYPNLVEIDEDIRVEYWVKIRGAQKPEISRNSWV